MSMFTECWSYQYLDLMRQRTDPLADLAMQVLFEKKIGHIAFDFKNDIALDALDLVPELVELKGSAATLPAWADKSTMHFAQQLYRRIKVPINLSLMFGSLAQGYAVAHLSELLALTGGMSVDVGKRLQRTTRFVFDVMTPAGFEADGRATAAILRVRLAHAAVRGFAQRAGWDRRLGEPINQEDMLGTLMGFSICVLDSLAAIGIKLNEKEESAYLHHWAVIGVLLGIEEQLIPHTPADARTLMQHGRMRHYRSSAAGTELVQALVEFISSKLPRSLHGLAPSWIRVLAGEGTADLLRVPHGNWTKHLLRLIGAVGRVKLTIGRLMA